MYISAFNQVGCFNLFRYNLYLVNVEFKMYLIIHGSFVTYLAGILVLFNGNTFSTRQSEMADLARRATRWVGTLSDGNVHVKFHDDRLRNGGDITY